MYSVEQNKETDMGVKQEIRASKVNREYFDRLANADSGLRQFAEKTSKIDAWVSEAREWMVESRFFGRMVETQKKRSAYKKRYDAMIAGQSAWLELPLGADDQRKASVARAQGLYDYIQYVTKGVYVGESGERFGEAVLVKWERVKP